MKTQYQQLKAMYARCIQVKISAKQTIYEYRYF